MNLVDFNVSSISQGGNEILSDVQFSLPPGKSIGVIGPSGVGKSTILRVIAGFHNEYQGECKVEGIHVSPENEKKVRGKLSFLFQRSPLMEDMTLLENLELALLFVKIPKEEKKESIYEVLDRLKLSHAMRQYPDQLSGGMRRRAVLAAAILRRPKILLCDEPFTGQDPVTKDDLVQLFSLIREEYGFSMILVSHDVRETLQLCDETILLMDGKLQAKGDKEALMSGASDRARRFMELGSYV